MRPAAAWMSPALWNIPELCDFTKKILKFAYRPFILVLPWARLFFKKLFVYYVVTTAADIICSKRKFIQNGESIACRPSKGSSRRYVEQEIGSSKTCLEPYRTLYGYRRLHCRWCQSKYWAFTSRNLTFSTHEISLRFYNDT